MTPKLPPAATTNPFSGVASKLAPPKPSTVPNPMKLLAAKLATGATPPKQGKNYAPSAPDASLRERA